MEHALGVRVETFNPEVQIGGKMQSLEASKRASREIYTAEQSRWNRGWKNLTKYETGVSPERLADYEKSAMESLNGSYDLAMEAYVSTIKDASVTARDAKVLGLSTKKVVNMLKEAGFSDDNGEIQAILSGNFSKLRLKFKRKEKF